MLERWLRERGIKELFPIQRKAIEAGLFDGRSLLISAPTGSGKTLVGEMAIVKALTEGNRALYLVPLRSIAFEKRKSLEEALSSLNVKVEMSVGDYHSPSVPKAEVLVATYERGDSLVRHSSPWLREVSVVVIDEIHYLSDPERGPIVESLVSRLLDKQIIAISATVANAREIARWMGATLVQDEWRPVQLREGVYYKRRIKFVDGEVRKIKKWSGNEKLDLILDSLRYGQTLVFTSTRRKAEELTSEIYEWMKEIENPYAKEVKEVIEGSLANKLYTYMKRGVAFHHAGLTNEARVIVEEAFRKGYLRVIVATPTLAAGVNLPARTVIIEDYKRFEDGRKKMISVMEYKQMAGRAGRPGLDEVGEAIIIARSKEVKEVEERFIKGKVEEVKSALSNPRALRRVLLATFASEVSWKEFISKTLYARQVGKERALREAERVVRLLESYGMVFGDKITPLGKLVNHLYLDPLSAAIITDVLKRNIKFDDIAYLHMISATPDMPKLRVKRSEERKILEELYRRESELFVMDIDEEISLDAFKTALVLEAWINEVKEEDLEMKFKVYPGDVRFVADTATWLAYSASELAKFLGRERHREKLVRLEQRLRYGVREELVELVKIPYIGRSRARLLYERGIRNLDDLRRVGLQGLKRILGERIAEKVWEGLQNLT